MSHATFLCTDCSYLASTDNKGFRSDKKLGSLMLILKEDKLAYLSICYYFCKDLLSDTIDIMFYKE